MGAFLPLSPRLYPLLQALQVQDNTVPSHTPFLDVRPRGRNQDKPCVTVLPLASSSGTRKHAAFTSWDPNPRVGTQTAAAATAPVSVSQEPPEPEAAPVSTPNDAGTPAPAQRTAAAPGSALSDAGTPAPDECTAQVQGKAPGPRMAQRETPGPRAARPEVQGPRSAQQGSPEAVPVCRENLQEKDRQVTVAEPPGRTTGSVRNRDSSSGSGEGVEEVEYWKSDSSKTTCREIRTRREVKSKHRYPLWSKGSTLGTHNESSGAPACEKWWQRC